MYVASVLYLNKNIWDFNFEEILRPEHSTNPPEVSIRVYKII
jgi:hypothetical protein